jgi:hypothetical protein
MTRASLIATLSLLLLVSLVSQKAGSGLHLLKQAALHHAKEWCEGQAERIEQALRPHLDRCGASPARRSGEKRREHLATPVLGPAIRAGVRSSAPAGACRTRLSAQDVCGNAPRVKVNVHDWHDWIDGVHLSRIGDRWVIVEVSWGFAPHPKKYHIPRNCGLIRR